MTGVSPDKCQAVMLVVVGEKCHYRILMLYPGKEQCLVPGQHLFEIAGSIDDVCKRRDSILRYWNSPFTLQ